MLAKVYRRILSSPALLALVILLNLGGTAFGFYYYWDQLQGTSPALWIFVPDCPLYTLLLIPALILLRTERLPSVAAALVFAGLLKYGLWTVFIILYHADFFLSPAHLELYLPLLILHAGMAAESGLVLTGAPPLSRGDLVVVLGWLIINDVADYVVGVHPIIPLTGLGLVAAVTVGLSFACMGVAYKASRVFQDL